MSNTKQVILDAAATLAAKQGFRNVTRSAIAAKVGIATGTVSYHFGTMAQLQNAIVNYAVDTQNMKVLAQALGEGHPIALRAPQSLRTAAAKLLSGL